MASSSVSAIAVLAVLVIFGLQAQAQAQASTSLDNILSPLFSPIFDEVCKDIECGKGTCKPSSNSTFFFECECDPGWKQADSLLDDHLKFLPCIIPNCTMDYSCSKASPPAPPKIQSNDSIFDPCYWSDCGGGSCNRTSKFTYNCECSEGYYNLLNVTTFPCLKECSIGMDCSSLGIITSNKSSAPAPPSLADNGVNEATRSSQQGTLFWLIILSLAMLV